MRKHFLSIITGLVIVAFLSSCGGGGGGGGGGSSSGGSGGISNVSITVGGSGQTAKVSANKNIFFAKAERFLKKLLPNSAIAGIPSSVSRIVIAISASDMKTITDDFPVPSGITEITKTYSVTNGSSRIFTISEFDSSGYLVYRGETTASLNGGAVDLPVNVKTRDNALTDWFERFRQVLNKKPNLTAADLDPFFSATYGIDNGYDRTQEINDYLNPNEGPPTDIKKITGFSGLTAGPIGNGKYEVKGKALFDDGSYAYLELDADFTVAYEDNTFKLKGNGYYSKVEITAESHIWTNLIANWYIPTNPWNISADPSYKSGLSIDIKDRGGRASNTKYAVVKGPGLPANGVTGTRVSGKDYTSLDPSFQDSSIPTNKGSFYVMTDGNILSIPDNSIYTVTIKDVNNNILETRSVRLPRRPFTVSELSSGNYFMNLTKINGNTPASSYNYISAANIGSTLTFEFSKPTAFSPIWLEAELNYWDGGYGNTADKDVTLLLTKNSGSITTTAPSGWTPYDAHLKLQAEDPNNRVLVYHWLFQ